MQLALRTALLYSPSFIRGASHGQTGVWISCSLKLLGKVLLILEMLREAFLILAISSCLSGYYRDQQKAELATAHFLFTIGTSN